MNQTAELKELSEKISTIWNEIILLKTKLTKTNHQSLPADKDPNPANTSPDDGPLSPEIRVLEVNEVELTPEAQNMSTDSSTNRIDEFVNDNDSLNSRFLTNQLPQLVQQNT